MSVLESKFVVFLCQDHDSVTHHLLEGFQAKLEETSARVQCDIFNVPTPYQLPYAIQHLPEDKGYDGIVALGCFLGEALSKSAVVLDHCLHQSTSKDIPFLPIFVEAKDIHAARDQVFGPDSILGYDAALQLLDLKTFIGDVDP